jgi:guanylate kinase
MKQQGHLYIITAPSGTGKTTVVNKVLEKIPELYLSLSCTTRAKRSKERQNVHYQFVSQKEFAQLIEQKAFLEYAQVYGSFYGTTKQAILNQLKQGQDVLLEIDWQGARQVKKNDPNATLIYMVPPSISVLKKRLTDRQEDQNETIDYRMSQVKNELAHYHEFDYIIVNDSLNKTIDAVCSIITASRLTLARQSVTISPLLKALVQIEEG